MYFATRLLFDEAPAATAAPSAEPLIKIFNFKAGNEIWEKVLVFVIFSGVIVLLGWLALFLVKKLFANLKKKNKSIHINYLERIISIGIGVAIVVLLVSSLDGTSSFLKTALGGTAVVTAVAAFAGQDIIKDVLAGMMISLQRPFELGDRIELENGMTGIVEDMTSRHVVLIAIDTVRIVIPNSKLNTMLLKSYSYRRPNRSAHFRFSVGYDSDMALVKRVIARAVEESPLSIPGKKDAEGKPAYSDVYFIAFADSALIMAVTVYYEKTTISEQLINDINTRVREALIANHIEIPYNYVNVVNVSDEQN